MKKQLEFFFDFMSPFAYLAESQLSALADRYNLDVRYVPLDLPVAKLAAGNTGPSNRMVPAKLRYLTTDMQRWAKKYNLPPLVFPSNFNSERANRGLFYAIDKGQQRDYVHQMFQAVWGRGEDMADEAVLRKVAEGLGWSGDDFLAYTLGEDSEKRYAASNKETHERGVFGVPTMFVDGEMWWGNDRLKFVEEYLESHKS
jgi:2-hydroxychromene-2-carboxylate isomerase